MTRHELGKSAAIVLITSHAQAMLPEERAHRTTILDLLRVLQRETRGAQTYAIGAALLTGIARGGLLASFNAAAAAGRHFDPRLLAMFLGTLCVYLVASFEASRTADIIVRMYEQKMRLRIGRKLLNTPLRAIEALDPGKVFAYIGMEVERIASACRNFILCFQSSVILVFALGYLLWLSFPGFIATLITIIISAGAFLAQENRANERLARARAKETEYYDVLYDLVHGFKELKLGRPEQQGIRTHLRAVSDEARGLGTAAQRLFRLGELTSQAFTFGLIGVLLFALPLVHSSDTVSAYQLLATILFAIAPAEQLISAIPDFSRASVSLDNVARLERQLEYQTDPREAENTEPPLSEFSTIELRSVQFEFQSANPKESFNLGPIDLVINRGEILLVCGGNGAGKTTLLKLITGLYRPTSGEILIDGIALPASDYGRYRELFAAVFADVHLMRRVYGLDRIDPETVAELLSTLQLSHKTAFEDGRFSSLDLSAGQRKRLAYAISRMRERQIYVFDEFAADQDPEFRRFFYTELLPGLKRQGKTVIAVTHDDRWFGAGDRLAKLDYGRIVGA